MWAEHSSSSGPSAPGQLVGRVPLEGSSSRADRGIKTHTDIYSISKGSCHRKKGHKKRNNQGSFLSLPRAFQIYNKSSKCLFNQLCCGGFFSTLHSWPFCLMAKLQHSHAYKTGDTRLICESLRLTLHEIRSLSVASLNLSVQKTEMMARKACWGKGKNGVIRKLCD